MASTSFTWKILGFDKIKKMGDALRNDATQIVHDALQAGAYVGKGAMQRNAPRLQYDDPRIPVGFLERHFDVRVRTFGNGRTGSAWAGPQGKIDYPLRVAGRQFIYKLGRKGKQSGRIPVIAVARFLEFGTRHAAAHPWLTRSIESVRTEIIDAMLKRVQDGLERLKQYAR